MSTSASEILQHIAQDAVANKVSELRDTVEQMLQDEPPSKADAP